MFYFRICFILFPLGPIFITLIPFLHVTNGGDQTPIQKALPELRLVRASSFLGYEFGI
jgi:hypothetical protein